MRQSKLWRAASLMLLALLASVPASSQITQTQCNIISGQGNVTAAIATTRYTFDNRFNNCQVWQLSWFAEPSSFLQSSEIDFADDSNGTPGAWSTFPNTPTTGPNPSFNTVSGLITVTGYHPWISALLVFSVPGTAVTNFFLHGTNSNAQQALSVSGNSSTVINAFVGNGTNGIVPNSGQTAHQVVANLANSPGHTCVGTDFYTVTFSGTSLTGGVSVTLMTLEVRAASTASGYATGFYPIYSFFANPSGAANVDCSLTVSYLGFPYIGFGAVGSNPYGSTTAAFSGGTPIHPITECSLNNNFVITAGAVSTIFGVVGSMNVKVCQLIATTPTAATVFTLGINAANCTTIGTTFGVFNMAVGVPITIGSGLGAAINMQRGNLLCATSTTGNVNVFVSYDVLF